ncbi:hypothetical protein [Streptomyces longwoodensis]|uniref:hypothetical protein n=1 Tax=Streptomyces longwoodensis TaxID=68231 RepID=UPI0033C2464E
MKRREQARSSRDVLEVLRQGRVALLDALGLGLLATGVFTWSTTAGLLASGTAVLAMNWRLNEGAK